MKENSEMKLHEVAMMLPFDQLVMQLQKEILDHYEGNDARSMDKIAVSATMLAIRCSNYGKPLVLVKQEYEDSRKAMEFFKPQKN